MLMNCDGIGSVGRIGMRDMSIYVSGCEVSVRGCDMKIKPSDAKTWDKTLRASRGNYSRTVKG
jgi:hypothetical protein